MVDLLNHVLHIIFFAHIQFLSFFLQKRYLLALTLSTYQVNQYFFRGFSEPVSQKVWDKITLGCNASDSWQLSAFFLKALSNKTHAHEQNQSHESTHLKKDTFKVTTWLINHMLTATYFSCGDCFWDPGPVAAGMGPGWKAWLGEVVADRARWGEPWADGEGEAEAERCPPAGGTHRYT